jgi:hypothetical protein
MKYTSKYIIKESVKFIQAKEAQDNPSNSISRQNTDIETAQGHSGTDHVKVVVRQARPSASAPPPALPDPTLRRRFIQCTLKSVAWVLTKNTSPN